MQAEGPPICPNDKSSSNETDARAKFSVYPNPSTRGQAIATVKNL